MCACCSIVRCFIMWINLGMLRYQRPSRRYSFVLYIKAYLQSFRNWLSVDNYVIDDLNLFKK